MVPSEGKDFTGSHRGFEGEEEGAADLGATWAIEVFDKRGNFITSYSPASGWRLLWK